MMVVEFSDFGRTAGTNRSDARGRVPVVGARWLASEPRWSYKLRRPIRRKSLRTLLNPQSPLTRDRDWSTVSGGNYCNERSRCRAGLLPDTPIEAADQTLRQKCRRKYSLYLGCLLRLIAKCILLPLPLY